MQVCKELIIKNGHLLISLFVRRRVWNWSESEFAYARRRPSGSGLLQSGFFLFDKRL